MAKIQNMTIYKNHFILYSHYTYLIRICHFIFGSNSYSILNHMYMSSNQDDSSDLLSYGGRKQTNLSRFISAITPSLLRDMKKYLQRNKFLQQMKEDDSRGISLYEDIFMIVTLKENENVIFSQKGKLKKTLQDLAIYTKRKFITVDERLRKKLSQLTPEHLKFYLDNKKDIVFKGNSRQPNTQDMPQHLRITLKQQAPSIDSSRVINLDSSSDSRIIMYEKNQNINNNFKKKPPKRTSVEEQVIKIMMEPDNQERHPFEEKIDFSIDGLNLGQNTDVQNKSAFKLDKNIDLKNPIQRGVFGEKILDQWRRKNISKYINPNDTNLIQSKICYNFRRREYMFVNPQLMKSIFNSFKRQEQLLTIRNRQKVQVLEKKVMLKTKQLSKNDKTENFNEIIQRETQNENENNHEQQQQKYTVKKLRGIPFRNIPDQTQHPAIEIEDSIQEKQVPNKQNSQNQNEISVQNLIQFIEDFANKYDPSKLTEDARILLQKGLKEKERVKNLIKNQEQQKKNRSEQNSKVHILNLLSEQQEQKYVSSQKSDAPQKRMIYWFNNSQKLYEEYQQDPYRKGYLMWCDDQDEILQKANMDFNYFKNSFQKLVEYKTIQLVRDRIKFLKIKLKSNLEQYINKIVRR